jgi:DNA mismatch repair protein MutS2
MPKPPNQNPEIPVVDIDRRSADTESAIFAAELGECPEIDLHGESADQAIRALDTFLHSELMRGAEAIRIIHGRGNQVLRKAIHAWLAEQRRLDLVSGFRDAQNTREQNGVTYAALHRLK